ncbi:MAG: PepSY domain-containing protein [Salaquimonas sp.]
MKKLLITTVSVLIFATAAPAFASGNKDCGNADRSTWMSEDALKTKVTAMGYDVKNVKVEDGCYEIYAIKDGKKVEAYLNPVTAEVVREKLDD